MAERVKLLGLALAGLLAATGATGRALSAAACPACAAALAPPAYEWAARTAGVPPSVLFAVAREESGLPLRGRWVPWPWTLNVAGAPQRFATRTAACAALKQALESVPSHRIDVGLGQIDVGYYGDWVSSPCELLDPYRNLLLTATLLRGHHEPGEDWMVAIGRYHRPAGGALAAQYRREVGAQLARVLAAVNTSPASEASPP